MAPVSQSSLWSQSAPMPTPSVAQSKLTEEPAVAEEVIAAGGALIATIWKVLGVQSNTSHPVPGARSSTVRATTPLSQQLESPRLLASSAEPATPGTPVARSVTCHARDLAAQ